RTTVEMGNAALDKYESSGGLSWEERLIVRGFLDSNQDDTRLAVQKTVQGNHAEMLSVLPGVGLVGGKGGGGGASTISPVRVKGDNGSGKLAEGQVSGLLPKPGATSVPASGVGAGAEFKVDSNQLGKKLGKHVQDFGGNAANAMDRKVVMDKIHDIGQRAEKVIPGTFAGQGAGGIRGDVFFRIKGSDVVVTKPDGTFITILKDGVTLNPSVRAALRGEIK
ncbi:hypothetical protein DYL61_21310, partial [Pseudomonas nabeulensis]